MVFSVYIYKSHTSILIVLVCFTGIFQHSFYQNPLAHGCIHEELLEYSIKMCCLSYAFAELTQAVPFLGLGYISWGTNMHDHE